MKEHPELRLEINCMTAARIELPLAPEGDALRAPEALCARFNVHALEVGERLWPHLLGAVPLRTPACSRTHSNL